MILVDYDNIEKSTLRHGVVHVVNRIVSKIDPTEVDSSHRITIRLYGGWYLNNSFTHKAQLISSDILANFPNTAMLSDGTTNVVVNCEMAYSILADPTNHLFSTFRPRGFPNGLGAKNPIVDCGCTNTNCPIIAVHDFLVNNVCGTCKTIKPEDVYYRGEQKLVDTMLTCDLIFSSNQPANLGVVSSDDDFWPGIKTTLINGKKVIQLHTRKHSMPSSYTRTTRSNYIQKQL